MCDDNCEKYETFNPEKEYEKFLKTKPNLNTANLYENLNISERITRPHLFKGYGMEVDENPMYRTVNSEYGYYSPNVYTIPSRNFPLPQKFSNNIYKFGMYRNFSLNTQMDKNIF